MYCIPDKINTLHLSIQNSNLHTDYKHITIHKYCIFILSKKWRHNTRTIYMGVIFTKQKPNKCRHILLHFININLKEFVKKCASEIVFLPLNILRKVLYIICIQYLFMYFRNCGCLSKMHKM